MVKKLTIEDCHEIAVKNGGECLSTEYKSNKTSMEWRCKELHSWSARLCNIKNGQWCPICGGSSRHTLEDCIAYASNKLGKCLSNEYINNKAIMLWECSEFHQFTSAFGDLLSKNIWCPPCNEIERKNKCLLECKELAISKGGRCLSDEYIDSEQKLKWQCEFDHTWFSTPASIKNSNSWCPECVRLDLIKHTIEECQSIAEKKGGKCLSTEYKNIDTPLEWQCKELHPSWKTTLNHILFRDSWCPTCAGTLPLGIEECHKIAEKNGGKCLSTEYKDAHSPLDWQCKKLHEWTVALDGIKYQNTWCPYCSSSRSETQMCDILKKIYPENTFIKIRPDWLKNDTGSNLELDAYCEELKLAFEYNGLQHEQFCEFFHNNDIENFKNQQLRDKKKIELCLEHKIKLIIIPSKYSYLNPTEMEEYIKECCEENKLN